MSIAKIMRAVSILCAKLSRYVKKRSTDLRREVLRLIWLSHVPAKSRHTENLKGKNGPQSHQRKIAR